MIISLEGLLTVIADKNTNIKSENRSVDRVRLTLNRFDTVSSGAGEKARLIYVNYERHIC